MSNKVPNIDFGKIDFFEIRNIKEGKSISKDINIIETIEGILEILDDRFIQGLDKIGITFDDIKGVNDWSDIGLDEYDIIDLTIEIEKVYDCNIFDVAAEQFMRVQPNLVWNSIVKKIRDDRISQILK